MKENLRFSLITWLPIIKRSAARGHRVIAAQGKLTCESYRQFLLLHALTIRRSSQFEGCEYLFITPVHFKKKKPIHGFL